MPPNGVSNLADSPSDLDSWKKVATEDDDTKADPLSFSNSSPASARTLEASDLTLSGDDADAAGAEPNFVGPAQSRSKVCERFELKSADRRRREESESFRREAPSSSRHIGDADGLLVPPS